MFAVDFVTDAHFDRIELVEDIQPSQHQSGEPVDQLAVSGGDTVEPADTPGAAGGYPEFLGLFPDLLGLFALDLRRHGPASDPSRIGLEHAQHPLDGLGIQAQSGTGAADGRR